MAKRGGFLMVTLIGGHLDGDKIVISPNSSIGPPNALEYFGTRNGHSGFYRYEAITFISTWPEQPTALDYQYVSFSPLFEFKNPPTEDPSDQADETPPTTA